MRWKAGRGGGGGGGTSGIQACGNKTYAGPSGAGGGSGGCGGKAGKGGTAGGSPNGAGNHKAKVPPPDSKFTAAGGGPALATVAGLAALARGVVVAVAW